MSRHPRRHRLGLVVLLSAFAMLATACGGSESTASANYASVPDGEAAQPADASSDAAAAETATGSGDTENDAETAGDETFDTIATTFDSFLAKRAAAITGDLAPDELGDVATAEAIDQVRILRTENETRLADDSYAAMAELMEWGNVTTIERRGSELVFIDCTERQRVNTVGSTAVQFVTNEVVVVVENGEFKVAEVNELQAGEFTIGDQAFGCVPPSFTERAVRVAETAVAATSAMTEDPRQALADGLPAVYARDARDQLERALESLADQGLSRVADETVQIDVIGMDVIAPDFTVVVSVCRTYPTGRTYVDAASGQPTVSDLATGSSYEEWIYVQLEPVASGTESADVAVAVEDRGPNCQKG